MGGEGRRGEESGEMIRRGERRHDDGRDIEAAGRREGWTTGRGQGKRRAQVDDGAEAGAGPRRGGAGAGQRAGRDEMEMDDGLMEKRERRDKSKDEKTDG